MFCPVKVKTYLIKNTSIADYNLFIASSTSRADRYLTFDRSNLVFYRAIRTPPK